MQFVEPIRDVKKISQIKNQLRWEWNIRDLLMFELGINSALRISDLLSIKVWDVFEDGGMVKPHFDLKEHKTWKKHRVTITPKVHDTLVQYYSHYPKVVQQENNYLFFSKRNKIRWWENITRKEARVLISKWCADVWLVWNYWWHTLRKTRGYQARKNWIPLEIIQNKLNHSSLSITKRYLGITAKEIEDACNKLDL